MILVFQIAAGIILAPFIVVIVGTVFGGLFDILNGNGTASTYQEPSREISDKEAEAAGYHYFDGAWYDKSNGGFEFKGVKEDRGDWP